MFNIHSRKTKKTIAAVIVILVALAMIIPIIASAFG